MYANVRTKLASEPCLRIGQQVERAHDRVGRRLGREHGAGVRGEPFRDLLAALVFDTGWVEHAPGLPERERVADSEIARLS